MTPNIRPAVRPHSECWEQDIDRGVSQRGQPGDVRRCVHGKVQLRTQMPHYAPVQGPGTDYWRTLSPWWDWKLYRLAVDALEDTDGD